MQPAENVQVCNLNRSLNDRRSKENNMTVATRVGVIGLGAMGLQMARHIASKGFAVVGTDISQEAMRRAEEHGVRSCPSAAEVGANADVVILMVATDGQVNDLMRVSGLLDR